MFGLKPHTIQSIQKVFAKYSEIESAILYGSRAKGNFRNGSDIDLTLLGSKIKLSELYKIELDIDELYLPYRIDLSIFEVIENQELIDHINSVGKVFYDKNNIVSN